MTNKKEIVELGKRLGSLLSSLAPNDRQKLLHNVFLEGKESKPIIEMVEY